MTTDLADSWRVKIVIWGTCSTPLSTFYHLSNLINERCRCVPVATLPIFRNEPWLSKIFSNNYLETAQLYFQLVPPRYMKCERWEELYSYERVLASIAIHCPFELEADGTRRKELVSESQKPQDDDSASAFAVKRGLNAAALIADYTKFYDEFFPTNRQLLTKKCFVFPLDESFDGASLNTEDFTILRGLLKSRQLTEDIEISIRSFAAEILRLLVSFSERPKSAMTKPITKLDLLREHGAENEKARSNLQGRYTKVNADMLILSGNPLDALLAYSASVESAKLTSDEEWRAASLEGQGAAAYQYYLQQAEDLQVDSTKGLIPPPQIEQLFSSHFLRPSFLPGSTNSIENTSHYAGLTVGNSNYGGHLQRYTFEAFKSTLLETVLLLTRESFLIYMKIGEGENLACNCALRYYRFALTCLDYSTAQDVLDEILDLIKSFKPQQQIPFLCLLSGILHSLGYHRKFASILYEASTLYESLKLWKWCYYSITLIQPWYHLSCLEKPECDATHLLLKQPITESANWYATMLTPFNETRNMYKIEAAKNIYGAFSGAANTLSDMTLHAQPPFGENSFLTLFKTLCLKIVGSGAGFVLYRKEIPSLSRISTENYGMKDRLSMRTTSSVTPAGKHIWKYRFWMPSAPASWLSIQDILLDACLQCARELNDPVRTAWYALAKLTISQITADSRSQNASLKQLKQACNGLSKAITLPPGATIVCSSKQISCSKKDPSNDRVFLGGLFHGSYQMIPTLMALQAGSCRTKRNSTLNVVEISEGGATTAKAASKASKNGMILFNPFKRDIEDEEVKPSSAWVKGEEYVLNVELFNPLNVPIEVQDVALLTEGVSVESSPFNTHLPSGISSIQLSVTPRGIGRLYITGITMSWLKFKMCQLVLANTKHIKQFWGLSGSPPPSEDDTQSVLRTSCTLCLDVIDILPAAQLSLDILKTVNLDSERRMYGVYPSETEKNISISSCVVPSGEVSNVSWLPVHACNSFTEGEEIVMALSIRNCSDCTIRYVNVNLCDCKTGAPPAKEEASTIEILSSEDAIKSMFTERIINGSMLRGLEDADFAIEPHTAVRIPMICSMSTKLNASFLRIQYSSSASAGYAYEVCAPLAFSIQSGISVVDFGLNILPLNGFDHLEAVHLLTTCGLYSQRLACEFSKGNFCSSGMLVDENTTKQFMDAEVANQMISKVKVSQIEADKGGCGVAFHRFDGDSCLACLDINNESGHSVLCYLENVPECNCYIAEKEKYFRWIFTLTRSQADMNAASATYFRMQNNLLQLCQIKWRCDDGRVGTVTLSKDEDHKQKRRTAKLLQQLTAPPKVAFCVDFVGASRASIDEKNSADSKNPDCHKNKFFVMADDYKVPLDTPVTLIVQANVTDGISGRCSLIVIPYSPNSQRIPEGFCFAGTLERDVIIEDPLVSVKENMTELDTQSSPNSNKELKWKTIVGRMTPLSHQVTLYMPFSSSYFIAVGLYVWNERTMYWHRKAIKVAS